MSNLIKKAIDLLSSFGEWTKYSFFPPKVDTSSMLTTQEAISRFKKMAIDTKRSLIDSMLNGRDDNREYYSKEYDKLMEEYLNDISQYITGLHKEAFNNLYSNFVSDVTRMFPVDQ